VLYTCELQVAARSIGSSVTGMLAVQVAGATIGNMVCINNILSAKAVMNMSHVPGGLQPVMLNQRGRVCQGLCGQVGEGGGGRGVGGGGERGGGGKKRPG
jgi:hypothetical protein